MKNIFYTIALLALTLPVLAQNNHFTATHLGVPVTPNLSMLHRPAPSTRGTVLSVDYDTYDFNIYGTDFYGYFVWPSNMHYDVAAGDTNWKQFDVAFDNLVDAYTGTVIDQSTVTSITVDSLYFFCGWENNSGNNDTIVFKFVKLNNNGYPLTTVLMRDTVIANDYLQGLDWLTTDVIPLELNWTTTEKHFGVQVEYYGSKEDTFGMLAGYPIAGPCGSLGFDVAGAASFPNSYSLWQQYESYGLLPDASGADIYYDCNSNGMFDDGVDGVNYIQNITLSTVLDVSTSVGINEIGNAIKSLSVSPNPASDVMNVSYSLENATDVNINIYDMSGKLVMNAAQGKKASGWQTSKVNVSNLASGLYMAEVTAGSDKVVRKISVNH